LSTSLLQQTTEERQLARELAILRGEEPANQLGPITRATFAQLSPGSQMTYIQRGGTVTNDPEPAKQPLPDGAIKRSAFDAMTISAQRDYVNGGGLIVDDNQVADK
jgi:hypothetical protein